MTIPSRRRHASICILSGFIAIFVSVSRGESEEDYDAFSFHGYGTINYHRTAPLWGIGLAEVVNAHTHFLHDGRARNLTEAILWHGGEAEKGRESFRKLDASDRKALLEFLNFL